MASKVEELREKLVDGRGFLTGTAKELNSILDLARAEGAEQERERIRSGSKYLEGVEYLEGVDEPSSFWHVPASVLAPTRKHVISLSESVLLASILAPEVKP